MLPATSRSDAVLKRLLSLHPRKIDLALDRILRLLNDLGNPQLRLPPVIHVAGTNGKGSACAFIRAMLEAQGLKVHVHTSPHLVHFHERIRIAGKLISEEALVSLLDEKGRPTVVERGYVLPPGSRIGPLTPQERDGLIKSSVIYGHYEKLVDRESAYEKLRGRTDARQPAQSDTAQAPSRTGQPAGQPPRGMDMPAPSQPQDSSSSGAGSVIGDLLFGRTGPRGGKQDGLVQQVARSAARTIGKSF